jgi:hypothetical protein
MMEEIKIIPDALRTLTGLTHQGYTPQTAIADIIDNSLAAGATIVDVRISPQPNGKSVVQISDNGVGMNGETLKRAMQIGSSVDLARTSLSVYGMGLKAASMSFSRRLAVVSRALNEDPVTAVWDMDTQAEKPWVLFFDKADENAVKKLDRLTEGNPGTIVIWEKADFKDVVLDHRKIKGKKPSSVEDTVKKYLSMVFHRYLEGTAKGYDKVEIRFNGEVLLPFNPVKAEYLDQDWVPITDQFSLELDLGNGLEAVPYSITTYLLAMGDDEVAEAELTMRNQGIYPYRQDRLLQAPDWLNVIAFHPDFNGVRVVLDLDPKLDSVTRTDMKKSGLSLPPDMWQGLKEKLDEYTKRVRRDKKRKLAETRKKRDTSKIHNESNAAITASTEFLEQPQISKTDQGFKVETVFGESVTELVSVPQSSIDSDSRIVPIESLDGGVLFEPRLNGAETVIYLNKSHPFYQKVYLACIGDPVAIQGFDFLIYSVSHAHLLTKTDRVKEQFRRMRFEMSEALRQFVLELEEPGAEADSTLDEIDERLI